MVSTLCAAEWAVASAVQSVDLQKQRGIGIFFILISSIGNMLNKWVNTNIPVENILERHFKEEETIHWSQ